VGNINGGLMNMNMECRWCDRGLKNPKCFGPASL